MEQIMVQDPYFVALLLVAISSAVGCFFIFKVYKKVFGISLDIKNRYDNLERLLLDLRDGTKTFYREKRKFARLKEDRISAKIADKGDLVKIINISQEGALLRPMRYFRPGELMDLNIYLPLFPQPIDVRARVVRVSANPQSQPTAFDVGVEYLNMSRLDKKRLVETMSALSQSNFVQ